MIYLTIALLSSLYGVDSDLAIKLAKIESNFNPKAMSKTKDGGLFQLNTRYHKFHNPNWIFDIEINSHRAMKTLANLKTKCNLKFKNHFVLCYNMGTRGASKLKNPNNQTYIKKLTSVWKN
jgi:hypothetical protein